MKVKGRLLKEAFAGFLAVLVVLSLGVASAFAQVETGQITVKVSDPAGAVVAGATVTLKSTTKGTTLPSQTTSSEGIAVFANLQPDVYEVTVASSGFANFTQSAQVTAGGRLSVEAQLTAQAQAAVVNVVAGQEGVEVNTQSQELSNVVSSKQISELPTLTRNPYDLVALSGNIQGDAQGSTGRGVGFSINGQRASSTNILLDGGDNTNTFTATVGQSIPLDAVQEFRVLTSNFTAEYGRAAGGQVNVATKAGSNSFHGTLYEFNRISALASNSFDNNANGLPKGVFTRNQFGYSIGGRIVKDKLFFFSSTEWTRVRSAGTVINLVPTPELLARTASNTQAFFSANPLATPINGTIFTVGQVVSTLKLGTGAFASLPSGMPAFGQVRYNVPENLGAGFPQNTYQMIHRVDYNLSDKTQLWGRFARESLNFFDCFVSCTPYANYNTGETDLNHNILLSVTHSFSPKLISQSKVIYNRLNDAEPLSSKGDVPTLYFFPNTGAAIAGFAVALPGFLPFTPGNGIPFGGPQNLTQFNEDLSWTRGAHQFRFGGQFVYIQDNRVFGAYETASESLGAQGNFTQALNNLVNGQLRQFQAAIFPQGKFPGQTLQLPVGPPNFTRSNRYKDWSLYGQDSWRVKSRLTLNLGLRYEYYGVQHNRNRNLDSNFYFGSGSNIFQTIRSGQALTTPNSPIGKLWKPSRNNFAPRVGFAWDVFGDGKMSVRGGYGIGYERNFGNVTFNVIQNPPNYGVISLIVPTDVSSIPITLSNAGPLAGSSGTKIFPATSLRAVDPNIKQAYAHFWSASVQRELKGNNVLSLEYSGSAGRRLYSIANINRSGTGLVYLNSTSTNPFTGASSSRLNGQYSNINFRGSNGRSNYNAFIASLEGNGLRKLGLRYTARYTFAKARDNLSSTFSESANNFNLGYLDPFNPDLDYGPADFDIHHRFSGSFTWEVPTWKTGNNFMEKYILGGWELNGIFVARSGNPFTVFDCTNAITTCNRIIPTGSIAFAGAKNPASDPSIPNRFILIDLSRSAPLAFANPITGTSEIGPFPANMTHRNAFRGPGAWNMDSGLYKRIRITERASLQLRFEVYNVFNHANLYVQGGDADVSSFDFVSAKRGVTALGAEERRNVQLAAKFIF